MAVTDAEVNGFSLFYSSPNINFFHGTTAPSGAGPPHSRDFAIALRHSILGRTPLDSGVPRGVVWGVQTPPPPKFRRYRLSSRSHEQEEQAYRFPLVVHCVLIRL